MFNLPPNSRDDYLLSTEQELFEQYYQWSANPTSLQYDRVADKFVDIGNFPFYQENECLPIGRFPIIAKKNIHDESFVDITYKL
jgi:hypothetical protein